MRRFQLAEPLKTPSLRNIELTGPFFVNGGQATLGQVVDFYSRRGDFPSADMDPNLERAGFGALDKAAVVAFLKSLTDERVRNQSAPFDHPSLIVPNGMVITNGALNEQTITIPAVGAGGGSPLPKFCAGPGWRPQLRLQLIGVLKRSRAMHVRDAYSRE